jgi:hypothetical protein
MKFNKPNYPIFLLTFTIILHLTFINTKTYYYENEKKEVTVNFTDEQYKALLYSSDGQNIIKISRGIKLKYLYFLPEKSILIIYFFYFVAISGLTLLPFKIKKND